MAARKRFGRYSIGILIPALTAWCAVQAEADPGYDVFVTNERSGDVTVISGTDFAVLGTIAVGKRPRGIHASPDGQTVYVALSGSPIRGPPRLDEKGVPIPDDDDDAEDADKTADGIGVIDVATRKLTGKISVGSDPEEFSLSKDGKQLYVTNEDVKTASVVDIATARVEHIIPVTEEPEGVTTTPDGRQFYVTCEAGGDIFVVDTSTYAIVAQFKVVGRPRTVDFIPGTGIGFIPSETTGELNVIDTAKPGVLKTITLPAGSRPMSVKVAPDASKVFLSNGRGGTVTVFDARTYEMLDTIKVGTRPWGIGISPDGRFLYAANGPSNDVSVVDLKTNKEVTRVKAGASPWGIAIVPKAR